MHYFVYFQYINIRLSKIFENIKYIVSPLVTYLYMYSIRGKFVQSHTLLQQASFFL